MDNINMWIMQANGIGVSGTAITFKDQNGRVVCIPNEVVDLLSQRLNESRLEYVYEPNWLPETSDRVQEHRKIMLHLEEMLSQLKVEREAKPTLKLVVDNT